jgi:hypothetical protein
MQIWLKKSVSLKNSTLQSRIIFYLKNYAALASGYGSLYFIFTVMMPKQNKIIHQEIESTNDGIFNSYFF